jgi:hypothetical protein
VNPVQIQVLVEGVELEAPGRPQPEFKVLRQKEALVVPSQSLEYATPKEKTPTHGIPVGQFSGLRRDVKA